MAKKLYYRIGEACKLLGIQPYVLRYWETEFPFLQPSKSKSGQRVYDPAQVDLIRRVKELLYEEEYTIAGAKKKLEAERAGDMTSDVRDPEPGQGSGVAESPEATAAERRRRLDSNASERIEKLLAGLEVARAQSREILQLIDGDVPGSIEKKAG